MPWIVVVGLGLCSIHCVCRNYVLRSLYPNLEDHSPGVDWYWPHIAHLINNIIAVTLAAIAVITVVITLVWRTMANKCSPAVTADRQHEHGGETESPPGGSGRDQRLD